MTTLATETPRARVTHVCEQCLRRIAPGERYYRTATVWDGRVHTSKTCAQCERYVLDLFHAGYYGDEDWMLPWIAEADLHDTHHLGLVWARRHFLFRHAWRWRGRLMDYPTPGVLTGVAHPVHA